MNIGERSKPKNIRAMDFVERTAQPNDEGLHWEAFIQTFRQREQNDMIEVGNELRGYEYETAMKLAINFLILHPESKKKILDLFSKERVATEVGRALEIGVLDFPGRALTLWPELRSQLTDSPASFFLEYIRLEHAPREQNWRSLSEQLFGFAVLFPDRKKELDEFKSELLQEFEKTKKSKNAGWILQRAAQLCLLFPEVRPELEILVKGLNLETVKRNIDGLANLKIVEGKVKIDETGSLVISSDPKNLEGMPALPERSHL